MSNMFHKKAEVSQFDCMFSVWFICYSMTPHIMIFTEQFLKVKLLFIAYIVT